jgi:hypothetical protein
MVCGCWCPGSSFNSGCGTNTGTCTQGNGSGNHPGGGACSGCEGLSGS